MKSSQASVVGIDLGASHLYFALADLRGKVLKDATEKLRPEEGPQKIIHQIKQSIRWMTGDQAGFGPARSRGEALRGGPPLRAIAIGVPSPVDPRTGAVRLAANLPGWRRVRLAAELRREFRVPVSVENDANMAAIGERWQGVARGAKNFVFVALGTGIGAGIFVDGKLYRGRSGAAGEVASINVEWRRWKEDFGAVGYLESQAGGLGIAADGHKRLGRGAAPGPTMLAERRDAYFVFEAWRGGNRKADRILERAFTILGVGIANVISVLDPELIVIGGGISKGAPKLILATVNNVVRRIHKVPPPVKLSSLGDKAQTYGAIRAALTLADSGDRL